MTWRRLSTWAGGVTLMLLLTMMPLSLAVVPVWASTIFLAKAFTSGDWARWMAILPAVTSYMSLVAAAVTKPWVVLVISAETCPTMPAAVSFTALRLSELVPGLGLWWPGWSAGAAKAPPVIRISAEAAPSNMCLMDGLLETQTPYR